MNTPFHELSHKQQMRRMIGRRAYVLLHYIPHVSTVTHCRQWIRLEDSTQEDAIKTLHTVYRNMENKSRYSTYVIATAIWSGMEIGWGGIDVLKTLQQA